MKPDLDRFSRPLSSERRRREPSEDELAEYKQQELESRIERMTGRPIEEFDESEDADEE